MSHISVRYIASDVDAAVEFYPTALGFKGEMHPEPGGWNRIQLEVDDLDAEMKRLQREGTTFRTGIITGKEGRQALVEDPSGNAIKLFEPAKP